MPHPKIENADTVIFPQDTSNDALLLSLDPEYGWAVRDELIMSFEREVDHRRVTDVFEEERAPEVKQLIEQGGYRSGWWMAQSHVREAEYGPPRLGGELPINPEAEL